MKETDLTHVHNGDPVSISVDTYPGHTWTGHVDNVSPVTGSAFSVLPAENASGNWVKVVQRIPVRIAIERHKGDPELRGGMSAVVDIDTGNRRWSRMLFGER
jgi:membrane fusion protein (multidrug efflux system)